MLDKVKFIRYGDLCDKKNAQDVKNISGDFENDLEIYVKLFTIIYADDTVLLAESAEELQSELNYF